MISRNENPEKKMYKMQVDFKYIKRCSTSVIIKLMPI